MAASPGRSFSRVAVKMSLTWPISRTARRRVAVGRDDAGRLLAAVLKRVQAEVGEICRFRVSEDSNDPAHRAGKLAHWAYISVDNIHFLL